MKNDLVEHIKWLRQSIKDVKRLQAELDRQVAVMGKVKRRKKGDGVRTFNAKKKQDSTKLPTSSVIT